MLIVIEGADLCGKTSLARRIADKLDNAQVVHAGVPTRHPLEEYETALDNYVPGRDNLILDRWHVGEYVWPKIFGRESRFNVAVQRHVEMYMKSRGAFIIHAVRDVEKLAPELVEHNEPLHPDKLDDALDLFWRALRSSKNAFGVWDYERHNEGDIRNFIWNASSYERVVTPVWEWCGGGWVGSEQPLALLVGDELGPEKDNRQPPNDIPFAPYDATSGRYLLDSLPKWDKFAVINSLTGRNGAERDLYLAWIAFGCPKVVALGERASIMLKKYGVTHNTVPHPQYWRRFKYNDREEYVNRIEEAACLR